MMQSRERYDAVRTGRVRASAGFDVTHALEPLKLWTLGGAVDRAILLTTQYR